MKSLMTKILGSDVINDLLTRAPRCFEDESIGNLNKQLIKRGYNLKDDWDEIYDKLGDIKLDYRYKSQNKKYIVFYMTDLGKIMSPAEFDRRVQELLKSIKSNLDQKGVLLNGSAI